MDGELRALLHDGERLVLLRLDDGQRRLPLGRAVLRELSQDDAQP